MTKAFYEFRKLGKFGATKTRQFNVLFEHFNLNNCIT